jgi:3-oxosteroid 1-dehydrogenase
VCCSWRVSFGSVLSGRYKIDIPARALERTVARFNEFCRKGRDEDFRRGEDTWERYKSGANGNTTDNPSLGPIQRRPFYAMSFNRSILGTKGGARTDASGRVLREDRSIVPGLYCAGNAMANPLGTRAVGPGTTIGPCMTWGYICANSLARADNRF